MENKTARNTSCFPEMKEGFVIKQYTDMLISLKDAIKYDF